MAITNKEYPVGTRAFIRDEQTGQERVYRYMRTTDNAGAAGDPPNPLDYLPIRTTPWADGAADTGTWLGTG